MISERLARYALLPLRLFLGATFTFAGLQKLANPAFFRASSPISIHAQLVGAARRSPIGPLLHSLLGAADVIGVMIALGELAVGVGVLVGLFTRVAALGGMLVSLMLFLSVSFHSSPYYTGSDIVFLFAWTPFLLFGGDPEYSLDAWLADMRARDAKEKRKADPADATRRAVVLGAMTAGVVAALGGITALVGNLLSSGSGTTGAPTLGGGGGTTATTAPQAGPTGSSTPTTTAGSGGGSASGTLLGPASDVPVGSAATFTVPSSGDPGIVVQPASGTFIAYDAVCPHAGCTVQYAPSAKVLACPCHGSEFDLSTGDVIQGPATTGLTPVKISESGGQLYAT